MKVIAIHWKPGPPALEDVGISVFHEYIDAAVWMDQIRPIKVQTFDAESPHHATPAIVAQGETGPGFFAVFRAPEIGRYDYLMTIAEALSCRWKRSAAQNVVGDPTWESLPNATIRVSA